MVTLLAHASAPPLVEAAWLIPAFPLAGAALLLLFGRRLRPAAGPIATIMMLASFVVGLVTLTQVLQRPAEERSFVESLGSWIAAGDFAVSFNYRIDPLSIVMILVVTGVGSLIHLYSIGYMRGDPGEARYFGYLNLFAFSMLVLVLANNFLLLYVGWELVGACSYLLIGFWFGQRENATAAKKAFITNRVGDVSFLIGIFLIFVTFGTLDFDRVFSSASALLSAGTATAVALLLFGGATAKSAQIPLYVWLPDAMAGPTPVSALIHAATMVTAGVYLVARTHVFFDLSPVAGDVVAGVGVATALLAGLLAIAQDDIKRVLAYSTVSQLGFMFVAVGVGAYAAGIFHLVTHAFFKALLFLGAGSVMHALANRTDITKMGGLAKHVPWTTFTWVLGWLAIIGFPGSSGFFSKDQILEGAYHAHQYVIYALTLAGVALTAFYMTRLTVLTFFGKPRYEQGVHPHESPVSMVFPLVVLGIASAAGGVILGASPRTGRIQRFLAPVLEGEHGGAAAAHGEQAAAGLSVAQLSGIALTTAMVGLVVALVMYAGGRFDWQGRRAHPSVLWRAARNRFYVDDAYQFLFTSAGRLGATALAYIVDLRVIDGAVNGTGILATRLAQYGRRLQNGMVRSYALGVLAGTVVLVAFLLGRVIT